MTLADVATDARRVGRPLIAEEPPLAALDVAVEAGFGWDEEDSADEFWYPQGVTSGTVDGRELVLVSWYSKRGEGVRISVVELGESTRYDHIKLIQAAPPWTRSRSPRTVRGHAGGIAWVRNRLYVADTVRGMRVFDLERICEVGGTESRWRWALPQVGFWRLPVLRSLLDRGPRFSFLSCSHPAGALLSGEYRKGKPGARIVRWPMPGEELRRIRADQAWETDRTNLQGALQLEARILLASSAGRKPGKLTAHCPRAQDSQVEWAVGPEDLAYLESEDLVMSLTEHPADGRSGGRVVFGVKPPALNG